MDRTYLLGVALAVLSGVLIQSGLLLQKKVVNEVPAEARDKGFMKTLLKNPRWVTGFAIEVGGGSVTFMLAQNLIGPALVPGLMASGFIVLAIGSVKMMGESLSKAEAAGIGIMIVGISLLGLSELGISTDLVHEALAASGTIARITAFTGVLSLLWIATHWLALRQARRKGIVMAFSNGFPFCLSNFWISPLLAVMFLVLKGKGTLEDIAIFAIASVILVTANLLGIRQTQEAFKFAQASNVIPVQQVPVQITPIVVYFYVFSLTPTRMLSGIYILAGALLIILSGFLLGRRQSEGATGGG